MRADEFQAWTKRFDNHRRDETHDLALALGLAAEAGEVANEFERSCRVGHELNVEKTLTELGDVLWGVARLADELGYSLEDLMQMNVNKLIKRYDTEGIPMSPATDSSAAVVYEERGLPLND